jgi:hypothetical protein
LEFSFLVAAMPFALLLSYMRDWFDEEALGKRSSIPDVFNTDNPLAAFVERMSRVGIFGVPGDALGVMMSPDPGKKLFSLDTDVYAFNVINTPLIMMKELAQADFNVTYSTFFRRIAQTY